MERSLVPLEHTALVVNFDMAANPRLQSEKQFQSRVVLKSRDSVLTEEPWQKFAEAHGFRVLPEDSVATNPAVHWLWRPEGLIAELCSSFSLEELPPEESTELVGFSLDVPACPRRNDAIGPR